MTKNKNTKEYSEGKIVSDYGDRVWVSYEDRPCRLIRKGRYIMETKLGRYLEPTEMIKYKDRDKTNLDPDNMEVIARNVYDIKTFTCPVCGKEFKRRVKKDEPADTVHYCSKKCAEEAFLQDKTEFTCPICHKKFNIEPATLVAQIRQRKCKPDSAGPFDRRECFYEYLKLSCEERAKLKQQTLEKNRALVEAFVQKFQSKQTSD